MAWFKVDDKLHDHRKTRRILRGWRKKRRDCAPMGLWALAGSWCADNLMDGFVPTDELDRWDDDGEALAARLVEGGLWHPDEVDGEPGFRFHEWHERQPTREQVEQKRADARERMTRVRQNRASGSQDVRANSEGTSQNVRSTPSRPDPTRPVPVVVQSSSTLTNPVLDDDDWIERIQAATGGDRDHAAKVGQDILARATTYPSNPIAYVLRAIGAEPDRYKPTARNARRAEECPDHPGEFPPPRCRAHTADQKAAG